MVLRLVLVGLVAGLGFTFPGQRDLEALKRSAQRWVSARAAEWDARTSSEEGTFIFVAEAPAPTPSEADQPVVSDQEFAALMEETVATFAQAELASRPRDAEQAVTLSDEIAPRDVSDSLAIAPPSEPAAVAAAEEPAGGDVVFESIVDEMASSFAVELAAVTRARQTELAFEAIIDEMALEFAAVATTSVQAEPAVVAAVPETAEAVEDLYPGEAYALNRISDGLSHDESEPAPAPVAVAAPVSRQERLTNAVRLTREAVYAWTSLLHGPAVVAISH